MQSAALAWLPREDGVFLTANPQQLVVSGSVADIPFVNGDCDDEGTEFSLSNANITYVTFLSLSSDSLPRSDFLPHPIHCLFLLCSTEEQLSEYLLRYYVIGPTNSTASEVANLLSLYPEDPAQGSPFDTGNASAITPQFKRISALLGDLIFQAPRRLLQKSQAGKQPQCAYSVYRYAICSRMTSKILQ